MATGSVPGKGSSAGSSSVIDTLSQLSESASDGLSSVLDTSNFEDDIPKVTDVPSLDSILNEDTDSAPTIDELGLRDLLNDEGVLAAPSFPTHLDKSLYHPKEGTILKQTSLEGISNQLTRSNVRALCGSPTAIAVGVYRVIGTSRGLALMFDSKDQMKSMLTPYKDLKPDPESSFGAVSAIDLIHDGTRLLIGHAKGLITHWDLESNKTLRFIEDAHPPGYAVLSIKFTDDPSVVIFSNSGGNVFYLKFRRNFTGVRTWTSECFFSGCNGEAFMFEPLKLESVPGHPLKEYCMVAVATVTQVIIISVAPRLEGLIAIPHSGKPNTLPLLSWQFVLIENKGLQKSESALYPVLAVARDNLVTYVQLQEVDGKPDFQMLKKLQVNYTITCFKWINSQIVVIMDTTERIHLLNVRDNVEIEVLDLKDVELVYGTSFYKSLETGGNVSPALAVASEYACYNSIVSYQNKLFLLGLHAVHKIVIKSWKERLASLVKEGDYVKAIELGLQFYEGKAKAVVGLSGSTKKRKEFVMDQVVDILQGFVDIKLIVNKPTRVPEQNLQKYYESVIRVAFNTCVRLEKLDLLFGPLYDTFSGEGKICKRTFLEVLYSFLVDKKISSVRTIVAKDLIEFYKEEGTRKELEQCILNIEATSFDIHHIVELCWSQQLYDAMFYIYNSGLHDYTTPLLELLLQLRTSMKRNKSLSDHYQKIGYKLLVYIRCCLSGLAYPSGNIPPSKQLLAKTSIFETILTPNNTHNPSDKARYPHIQTLLEFDTKEFLNVLSFHQSFSYIHQLMSDDQYSELEKEDCTKAVLDNADILLKTDVRATAELVVMDFPLEVSDITHRIRNNPDLQFEFLQGVFDPKTSKQDIQPPSHIVEKYIELLCLYRPEAVYNFLRTNDNYRLEEALDICAMNRVRDSIAYLLERTGDIKGAFKIILETFSSELTKFLNKHAPSLLPSAEFEADKGKVEHILQILLQLCQRSSSKVDDKMRDNMWLSTLELVLSLPRKHSNTQNTQLVEAMKSIRADVLNSVMGYIKLPDILQTIIEDPSTSQLKDVRPIIMKMLDTYNYEEVLLKATTHLLVHDVQQSLTSLCSLSSSSITSDSVLCCLCNRPADSETPEGIDDVIVFSCNHLYHSSCLGVTGALMGVTCFLCDKSAKPSAFSGPITTAWALEMKSGQKTAPRYEKVQLDHDQVRRLQKLTRSFSTLRDRFMSSAAELRLAPPQLN
uniref:Uncharacterized protein n=1 Tax=Amphimedon queenslandica TaxID=400682 RepID=A0A1X7VJT1_AMPQE